MLFCQGDKTILAKRKIAIIGARNASISGKSIAKNLAYNLSNDFAIVSGLARGIDTAAHQGSIENTQTKSTITVLPFGFENIYPQENVQLYKKIAKDGLVISETQHRNLNEQGAFYARNRIITLLSEAVVVIEAASKSGTMATAKMALDLGCEVLVIPGSPLDPRYYGSNFLIKNGAMLVQNHFDVLEAIGYQTEHNQISETQVSSQVEPTGNHNKSEEILSMLSETPISLDTLALNANIRMNELLCLISELEISGKVIKHSTNEVTIFRG
jgi:DNA processing protein